MRNLAWGVLLASSLATADDESSVTVSAGTYALVESYDYPYSFGVEYRARPQTHWLLAPVLGASFGPDGMGFVYAGIHRDFAAGENWVVTPSLSGGLFVNGDAVGVREHLEFQTGIAFSRQLAGGFRLGLAGYHISNGGLAHPNNGTESVVVFVSLPFRRQ
jgi:hypothetical protein